MVEQKIRIMSTVAPSTTFASQQNSIPLIRELSIVNDTENSLDDLNLQFISRPGFVTQKIWTIDRIAANGEVRISDVGVSLDGAFLNDLGEAVSGEVQLTLTKAGEVISEARNTVRVLARNEWGGLGDMADLLPAFSMPNDPAVDKLLKAASRIMEHAGKSGSIDGYTSGERTRVWVLTSAVWSAVCGLGLNYALPPASFETQGQKVRTPSQIADVGLATCLDLALFFTAALEQAGLNPFVVFTKGHAFAGVWLQPEQFGSLVVDEASSIRKREVLNELLVFETTLATQHPAVSFSQAVAEAKRMLAEAEEENFQCAIDFRRARMQRIRPMTTLVPVIDDPKCQVEMSVGLEEAPQLPSFSRELSVEALPDSPQTRLDQWQRRLLDLSMRNPLLNHRTTKGSIKLVVPDPGLLEDLLAQGHKIKVSAAPEIADGDSQRSSALHLKQFGEDVDAAYAADAIARHEVVAKLAPDELDARITQIYRTAKSDLEEGGANTLFIALGFLVWQRKENPEKKCRAPLILLPVGLERKSVRGGVRMTLGEDEARFNTTLLQMLQQDFELNINGLDAALPQDKHGVDVMGVWNTVREAVKTEPGFEVVEDVVLGTFSFAKYLMWKDLVDRTEQLKQSPVVKHLIETPREIYSGNKTPFPNIRLLDEEIDPAKIYTPLPADSSQMAAIIASSVGKDFVLIGPPGTGKSQTIANMIAQNMAEGRKVLFVAEKATALNVVYRRLKKLGLGEFCLELHSNKARKTDVLEQLRQAWLLKGEMSAEEWRREADKIKAVRDDLNAYVKHLHQRYPNGLTPYIAMGRSLASEDVPSVRFFWPSVNYHSQNDMDRLYDVIDRLEENLVTVSNIRRTGLRFIQTKEWSPAWAKSMVSASRSLGEAAARLSSTLTEFLHSIKLDLADPTLNRLGALDALAKALGASYGIDLSVAFLPDATDKLFAAKTIGQTIFDYRNKAKELSCLYADLPWKLIDLDVAESALQQSKRVFWIKRQWMRFKLSSLLKKSAGAKGKPSLDIDIPVLCAMRDLGAKIENAETSCAHIPGWSVFHSDVEKMHQAVVTMDGLRSASALVSETPDDLIKLRGNLKSIVVDANELLNPDGSIGRIASRYRQAYENFANTFKLFMSVAGADVRQGDLKTVDGLQAISELVNDICRHEADLNAWCAWCRARSDAMQENLEPLIILIETVDIERGETRKIFDKSYAAWWIDAVVDADPILKSFVPAEHERRIKTFCMLDEKFAQLTSQYVRAKLCGGLPSEEDAKKGSELGVLRRELEKKRAHKALRQLISEMPTALTQITPCLLMSPLSIAQYLSADQSMFDVVIFDEASQITVWDAIGAISRGKNVIVVGDTQQLPPTNFFNRQDDDDVREDVEQDLASILDEFLGAGVPQLALNWHYRSKYESLIAFSNQRFYNGNLVTFPSPITEDRAVRLMPVDGVYDRGASQTNRREAEAIVAEIVRRLNDQNFLALEQSIGVVTFNSKQQKLIEDLLDAERKKSPELDRFFDDSEVSEPIFVKNLESVQGDERDVMLFSITYGPDKAGAPPKMNFGPLNQQGGSRRLNVAVTRARYEMLVFATLRPDQIDLTKTGAPGVRDLKHFLEMAERGPKALVEADRGSVGEYESPFEEAVAYKLIHLGWQVIPQIGVSTFRIDLGIVHPDFPGKFLAGVECDGATYHRSATVRDRDKLREYVLRGLGWEIVRIWSTEWWINPDAAAKKLHEALLRCLDKEKTKVA